MAPSPKDTNLCAHAPKLTLKAARARIAAALAAQAEERQPAEPAPAAPRASKNRAALKNPPAGVSTLERHRRKCSVCNHRDREQIEELFVHWHSAEWIACVYRHAYAVGLHRLRRQNLCFVLEHLLERASTATVTGASVVRAVRAYACLTDSGEWVEPATKVISNAPKPEPVESTAAMDALAASPASSLTAEAPVASQSFASFPAGSAAVSTSISNREPNLLETDITYTKQRPEAISNREKYREK